MLGTRDSLVQPDINDRTFPDEVDETPPINKQLGTKGLELWIEQLREFTTSRGITGHLKTHQTISADETGRYLFKGKTGNECSEPTEPKILDDPLSIQLETKGRFYSLGLIEPDGTIYITGEHGHENRPQSKTEQWGTPAQEKPSGDLAHIKRHGNNTSILFIDGLGHGPDAYKASNKAREIFEDQADEPPRRLMEAIHDGLSDTRGGVVFVGRVMRTDNELKYCSVGNISAQLISKETKHLPSQNGTVGYKVPDLKVETASIKQGNSIVCHSDGIEPPPSEFYNDVFNRLSPALNAIRIHDHFKKGHDDAHVLVSRV